MKNLIYSGPHGGVATIKKLLANKFEIIPVKPTPEDLYPAFEKCFVFFDASMKVPITADLIDRAHNLELVITATTGATHIDLAALNSRSIPLLTLADQKSKLRDITAAAEHSWLLLMSCARRLRGAINQVHEQKWNRVEFPGIMLKGKTLGVIGLGRIGSWMARYATAFGMNVLGHDPYIDNPPPGVQSVDLKQLVKRSDFVSLHVNFTEQTRGMINKSLLADFKPGSIFINTSRGELVEEEALVEQLRTGRISAAGVDVLSGEPDIANNPLWQHAKNNDNLIITPHIGGFCPEAVDMVIELSCKRIINFFGSRI